MKKTKYFDPFRLNAVHSSSHYIIYVPAKIMTGGIAATEVKG